LFTAEGNIADANVLAFDNSFENEYESNDALKILNAGENFGILSNGYMLSIEARMPVNRTDSIHYNLTNLRAQPYQFRFGPENMAGTNISALLIDRYLQSRRVISLSDSTIINFSISSDPASAAADRFVLVFRRRQRHSGNLFSIHNNAKDKKIIPIQIETGLISVYPNPVADKLMQINFHNKPAGNYIIQLINSAGQMVYQQSLEVNGNNFNSSLKLEGVASGYYRLVVISEAGIRDVQSVIVK